MVAARPLGRAFPPRSDYAHRLLQRDFFQVLRSGSLYAVVEPEADSRTVAGSTRCTVALFLDRHGGAACPAFLFCQNRRRWLRWGGDDED